MSLAVIGAGYGRTGTLSLKSALETLGFVKCHHMIEVINTPGAADQWLAAIDATEVDWDALFEGFTACVDWPACHFYQALADYYPEAKVVLTVRDPLEWYQSMLATTLRVIRPRLADPDNRNLGTELVVKAAFNGCIDDAEHAVEMFKRHTQEVIDSIEPERLLVYNAGEGWGPLCEFLERPVPAVPFPRVNSRDEFYDIFFGNSLPRKGGSS
jgi:hypothetical protein